MFTTSVDSIISVFNKTIEKLESHRVSMVEKGVKEIEVIQEAEARRRTYEKEANRAQTISKKLKEVIS